MWLAHHVPCLSNILLFFNKKKTKSSSPQKQKLSPFLSSFHKTSPKLSLSNAFYKADRKKQREFKEKKWLRLQKHHLAIQKSERRSLRPSVLSVIPSTRVPVISKVTLSPPAFCLDLIFSRSNCLLFC